MEQLRFDLSVTKIFFQLTFLREMTGCFHVSVYNHDVHGDIVAQTPFLGGPVIAIFKVFCFLKSQRCVEHESN